MRKIIVWLILIFTACLAYGSFLFPNNILARCGDLCIRAENQKEARERHDQVTGGGACFPRGTKVTLANGSTKNIENVVVGDKVLSQNSDGNKSVSTVLALESPISNNMCDVKFTDNEQLRVTNGHPLSTQNGWKAIDPKSAAREDPGVPVSRLLVGDFLAKVNGGWSQVASVSCQTGSFQTYNLTVDNTNTFFAGGFLVHNKTTGNTGSYALACITKNQCSGAEQVLTSLSNGSISIGGQGDITVWTCFPAGTKVLMSNGDQKNIEDVKTGDKVISQSESGKKTISTVTGLDQPVRDHMCQVNFEDGDNLRLTNEHPLLTTMGWKAIFPRKEAYADPNMNVTTLSKGDSVIKSDSSLGVVKSISCWSQQVQTYNLILDGSSHTYFANGYLTHNKGSGDGTSNTGTPGDGAIYSCDPPELDPAVSRDTPTSATFTWRSIDHVFGQSVFVGTNKDAVNDACPNGVGSNTGCIIAETDVSPDVHSYTTGNLSPGTVYYWRVLVFYTDNGDNCLADDSTWGLTSCIVSIDKTPLVLGSSNSNSAVVSTAVEPSSEISSVRYTRSSAFVTFGIGNSSNTFTDSTHPYSAPVNGIAIGSGTIKSDVRAGSHSVCTAWVDVAVVPPPPWWGVRDSDVQSQGSILSNVPDTNPVTLFFGERGPGNFPGVPVYSSRTNLTSVNVSELGWLANSSLATSKTFNYAYFANQVPKDVQFNSINPSDVAGSLQSGGTADSHGYYWYKYEGPQSLTIPTTDLADRKVILFVNNADINITGNINLTDGVGFFMAIVGKGDDGTKGHITVDSAVGDTGPNLEGIYVADNSFSDTGGTKQLHIRGSLAAYGGVQMLRNLGDPNMSKPSELFEYAPDQILLFPSEFGSIKTTWKEVAP